MADWHYTCSFSPCRWRIHHNVADSVDALLAPPHTLGKRSGPHSEVRRYTCPLGGSSSTGRTMAVHFDTSRAAEEAGLRASLAFASAGHDAMQVQENAG